jgi:hypothetical protein
MKRDTASTRRMRKRKAAKVEGTTKDKMKKTEEETVERLVVWLFLDIICTSTNNTNALRQTPWS